MESITFLLQQLMKIPTALMFEANNYVHILQEDLKKFSKLHKANDYPIETYTDLLKDHARVKNGVQELFFEDNLLMGPFVVRVKELRDSLIKKVDDLNQVLFKQIKHKIENSTKKIESTVETVLKTIRNENYKNIE